MVQWRFDNLYLTYREAGFDHWDALWQTLLRAAR